MKLRILRSLTRLFITLVSLTRSLFSEKMFISNRCIIGLMPNFIKNLGRSLLNNLPDNNVQLTKTITIAAGSHQSLKVPTCKILHYVVHTVHVSTNQQLLLEFTILFGFSLRPLKLYLARHCRIIFTF
jgi:hypothetical protein